MEVTDSDREHHEVGVEIGGHGGWTVILVTLMFCLTVLGVCWGLVYMVINR